MNRLTRIVGILGLVAIVLPGLALGQSYFPLKATLVYSQSFQLLNDIEVPGGYAYVDSGKGDKGNPYIGFDMDYAHFTYGQFIMVMTKNAPTKGRNVKVLLDNIIDEAPSYSPKSPCYPNIPPDGTAFKWCAIRTMSECTENADGVLEQTGQPLNVMDMQIGETKYCYLSCMFDVSTDGMSNGFYVLGGQTPSAVAQVTVERDLLGNRVWVIKPVIGYLGHDYINRKLWHEVPRYGLCDQGVYSINFELRFTYK